MSKPKILIIGGNGKFGSWFVRFFEKEGISVIVGGRADATSVLIQKVLEADIVIVSVPISITTEVIRKIRNHVRKDALLCDFTSIKELPMKEMLKTRSGCGVTGIHPMFGPLVTTMKNKSVVFCSGRDNNWSLYLKTLFQNNGARIVDTLPKDHDEKMAIVQAFTHFVNVLFGATLKGQNTNELNLYSSPVFRLQNILSARVLGGKADLYAHIAISNPAFSKVLKKFNMESNKLQKAISTKNSTAFEKIYNDSAKAMERFIPIAQATSTELMKILDQQFVSVESAATLPKIDANVPVHVLGPEGTFSHIAAKLLFKKHAEIIFEDTIRDTFESVLNSRDSALSLVPIENSTQGIVQETFDCFTKLPVTTLGSFKLPVHLYLMGSTRSLSDIKVIRSHVQPLAQSRNWIRDHLPEAKLEPTQSSAAAMFDANETHVAYIGSIEAAKKYKLNILAENIQDNKRNATEFYVIAKSPNSALSKKLKASRTALILLVHDRPGVLKDILESFSKRGINVTKLHSKVSDLEEYAYYFYLEAEGLVGDKGTMDQALEEIDAFCHIKHVLGVV